MNQDNYSAIQPSSPSPGPLKGHFGQRSSYAYNIIEPETAVVYADPDVKFIYVLRKDTDAVCNIMAGNISSEYQIPIHQIREIIVPAYNRFMDGLAHLLGANFSSKGKTEIHILDPDFIDSQRSAYIGQRSAISLDPLMEGQEIESMGMSRGYLLGGTAEIGMVARPGFPSLHEQVLAIKKKILPNEGVDIFEDDIYTGGSLVRIIDMLSEEGIVVNRVIPGIQIGAPELLSTRKIEVCPAIQYHTHDGQGIDLGDPRDFLLGADGLVVVLNGKQSGRLPYILPFVSPAARLSIPECNEHDFSQSVLKLNRDFFTELEEGLALPLRLNHMNKASALALEKIMPEWKTACMTDIIDYILVEQAGMKAMCDYHRDHSVIKIMNLPRKVAFLDVNGTILPSDSKDGFIPEQDLKDFQEAVAALEKTGVIVGLNSDSPLPQLTEFAKKLGIADAPIIAENGAVLSYKGKKIGLREFNGIDMLKSRIQEMAEQAGIVQAEDIIAPEFGGSPMAAEKWAFGANRTNSLSIFAKPDFLAKAKTLIDNSYNVGTVSCDYSPEHNFLGIHSGHDFRNGKAKTLELLVREGHQVISIGDSMSDYACLPLPSRVVFVKDGISEDILNQPHVSVAKAKGLHGVIEALKCLADENTKPSLRQGLFYDV